MYGWIVRLMMRRAIRQLNAGDLEPLLSAYADDVRFIFPGQHSWAADYRSRDELEQWLQRFVRVGLHLEPQEIIVSGAPWNMTVCMRLTDKATAPDGKVVYDNRGMIFGKVVWGKIKSYEVYVDTQKLAEFDEYLESHEPPPSPQPAGHPSP